MKRTVAAVAVMAVFALSLGTSSSHASAATSMRPAQAAVATSPEWARQMLALVNAQRTKVGARPLVLCAPLSVASRKYARVMARTGHFDHTGPDGREPWDRGSAEGYEYRAYGENIAAGQDTVREVMRGWVNSPGHYANLVNKTFTHLGVGRADSSGRYSEYWVQNFGAGGRC